MSNLKASAAVVWMMALGMFLSSQGAVANAACPEVGFAVVEPAATSTTRTVKASKNRSIFVQRDLITTTRDITEMKLFRPYDGDKDDVTIQLKFAPSADQRLHEATTNHSGMRIAFLFDDQVLLNAVWEGPYGMDTGGSQVSLDHGLRIARKLRDAIKGCTAGPVAAPERARH